MTIMFEPDDISVDILGQMKDEFIKFWPQDLRKTAIERIKKSFAVEQNEMCGFYN